ncbi:TA system toxin CbtA family protein [Klebsiella oxytoca]|uniref:TA system toxin CbtA family protein n=1 Tax=Klebsiella oxytoca TaxID=571 RepID=UPI0039C9CC02
MMDINKIRVYQKIAARLLEKHFGLTLNDTTFHDDDVVMGLVGLNIPVYEAINHLVEKYHLDRIDQSYWSPRSPLLTADHFVIAELEITPENGQIICTDDEE